MPPQGADEVSPCHCWEGKFRRGNPSLNNESARARIKQRFFVPKDAIVANDYDLSINKYKQTEYTPVEYPPTSKILANIKALEAEIGKELKELE